jgi:hypothetical protein
MIAAMTTPDPFVSVAVACVERELLNSVPFDPAAAVAIAYEGFPEYNSPPKVDITPRSAARQAFWKHKRTDVLRLLEQEAPAGHVLVLVFVRSAGEHGSPIVAYARTPQISAPSGQENERP